LRSFANRTNPKYSQTGTFDQESGNCMSMIEFERPTLLLSHLLTQGVKDHIGLRLPEDMKEGPKQATQISPICKLSSKRKEPTSSPRILHKTAALSRSWRHAE
ncbi:hypothetical protein AMTR_s00171p00035350, partial [Amborella trichopoda]